MLDRRMRQAGVRYIEAALSKLAEDVARPPGQKPSSLLDLLPLLEAQQAEQDATPVNRPAMPSANVPKVLNVTT